MAFPGVNISISNGGLQQEIAVLDSVPCLAATAQQTANIHAVKQVYNLQDAEGKGYTEAAEPFIYNLLKEYYTELAGKQLLYVYGTAETETMADVLSVTNTNGIKKALDESNGDINLVAIARKPSSNYSAGLAFLDSDVSAAVTAAKTLAQEAQGKNTPIRIFVEGRVANEATANTYSPKQQTNGYAAVVLGGTTNDGSAAVSLALARAVKYPAHVKLGNGQNGALSALQIYIGTSPIEDRQDMETLHDAGFLTFHHRPGTAGYYFGRDNMCSVDDYKILVHGRVIDKSQRIAALAYLPYIENSIVLESNGNIPKVQASYYESVIDSAVRAQMSEQISDVKVSVDTQQDIVNTSTMQVKVSILPLGYLTWINVVIGLTANIE
ncbi:MAG: DUF2586 family protein [Prevotellaceae bacterium]|jgi:hypothetical protein|nr:DUF2586 family protein [Prevotellaceae bacterium]